MNGLVELVGFSLEGQRHALLLSVVRRVVFAVQVMPLPNAPGIVLGVIDFQGDVIPVLNVRRRFQLPERPIRVSDQFVIARSCRRVVALVVDEALGVIRCEQATIVPVSLFMPGQDQLQGVIKLDDGLMLIHDLDKFLSLQDASTLDVALDRAGPC
ncbi:chemotaxis protein CheW [Polaromonas sp. C04]|uniref:chemotaxis protein CheW n=1 Tax=Polaromonas sp. C04 TaxID=1945857 RepID=UPI000986D01D|nr:chemotaxis protein CheW [Polaromonas sp. C04]OOG57984.1 chemotaxis protein CheW [Polaromonas sp. C04]